MAQTNLLIKVLLCLIIPAYHAITANIGSNSNSLATFRYWMVLSFVFLSELFLDQLNLSPGFTVIKLAVMFWFVAPIENNGSSLIWEKVTPSFQRALIASLNLLIFFLQIIQPVFKVSKEFSRDILQNKLLEEITDTFQDFINHYLQLPSLSYKEGVAVYKSNPSIIKHSLMLNQENITAYLIHFH